MGCLDSWESAKRAWMQSLANTTPRKPRCHRARSRKPSPHAQMHGHPERYRSCLVAKRRRTGAKLRGSEPVVRNIFVDIRQGSIFSHIDGHGKQRKGRVHECCRDERLMKTVKRHAHTCGPLVYVPCLRGSPRGLGFALMRSDEKPLPTNVAPRNSRITKGDMLSPVYLRWAPGVPTTTMLGGDISDASRRTVETSKKQKLNERTTGNT